METKPHVLIIGGGIFGLTQAITLGEAGYQVTLVEKNMDLMQGASLVNQNRVHYGYHYPRSRATCEESLQGLSTFKEYYGDSIYSSFDKYYAIAKRGSHVTSEEFVNFCESLELPLEEKWPDEKILDRTMIDACWLTPEPIFDFHKLRQIAVYRILKNRNIRVIRNTQPVSISPRDGLKEVILTNGYKVYVDFIVNATYSGLSDFLQKVGKERIKAKFQLCVMPLLEMKEPPAPFGVTIMDGPFCSIMPKGFNKGEFVLYHVVHSVVQQHVGYHSVDWSPIDGMVEMEIMELSNNYYPILKDMKLRDSWITTRVVLPDQELDDARPTLVMDNGHQIYSVFSGKLTTCVDAACEVLKRLEVVT